jgi:RHS repeat-associated protein
MMLIKDYNPFGMILPGRKFNAGSYRFGFNGKENDNEVKGIGNTIDYGARIYDSRIGRWFSPDKEAQLASDFTPYRFNFDNPIYWIDFDGNLEFPLKGTTAINKHTSIYDFKEVWIKRKKNFECQSGDFEGPLTNEYKTYLKNPNSNTIIRTSFFKAYRESTPSNPMTSPHVGIDYRASKGTDVYSLGDGIIDAVDEKRGNLSVKYSNGDVVTFRHLSTINTLKVGQKVYEGEIIAQSGNTLTKSPHLHVEAVNSSGKKISPEKNDYGTVSNEQFLEIYKGDYKQLPGYKKDHPDSSPPIDESIHGSQMIR